MIWKKEFTLAQLNQIGKNNAIGHLAIEFTQVGDDFLVAQMPVDHRTMQPFGILHGGLSVALAETLGSQASYLACDEGFVAVGSEINASHLRPVPKGFVFGKAIPIKIGKTLQVWQIDIYDQTDNHCCTVRMTNVIIPESRLQQ